jgi:hypothetical protein
MELAPQLGELHVGNSARHFAILNRIGNDPAGSPAGLLDPVVEAEAPALLRQHEPLRQR